MRCSPSVFRQLAIESAARKRPDRAKVVIAGVECSTYTYLQGGAHRSLVQPEGFSPQALQANREAEHLLDMFRSAKRADPKTLYFVENPAAYMQHTEFARSMETELGLTRLRVTFCMFTVGRERVRKPTHLWTNSRVLIGMFQNDMFYCTPDKPCGCAKHTSVRPARGAGYRSRDAAWWPVEFASLIARVLANESRSLAAL